MKHAGRVELASVGVAAAAAVATRRVRLGQTDILGAERRRKTGRMSGGSTVPAYTQRPCFFSFKSYLLTYFGVRCSLPDNVMEANIINMFKKRLNKQWINLV